MYLHEFLSNFNATFLHPSVDGMPFLGVQKPEQEVCRVLFLPPPRHAQTPRVMGHLTHGSCFGSLFGSFFGSFFWVTFLGQFSGSLFGTVFFVVFKLPNPYMPYMYCRHLKPQMRFYNFVSALKNPQPFLKIFIRML